MIKPAEAFIDADLDVDEEICAFSKIKSGKNRSMPVRAHSSSFSGKHRDGARRRKSPNGMQKRFNKKVLHA